MEKEWWDKQWEKDLKQIIEETAQKMQDENNWVVRTGINGKMVEITPI